MTCPNCQPPDPCSACLTERLAKRPGRPKKALKRVNMTFHVHPEFPEHLRALAKHDGLSLGEAVEKRSKFKPKKPSKT